MPHSVRPPQPALSVSHSKIKKNAWQAALTNLITDPNELLQQLGLPPQIATPLSSENLRAFPLRVPRAYAARMEKGNPNDPLLLQVLSQAIEMAVVPGYEGDPLKEKQANPVPGLLHKYPNRVLVTLTSTCAVHCRYCFRRHFPYQENNPGTLGWDKIFDYIAARENIDEVILSGGDPLAVNDKMLRTFSDRLAAIAHVKRLRIHTRLPIVIPERVTDELIAWMRGAKFAVVMVVHANHPSELDQTVTDALLRLRQGAAAVLNQSVLLQRVNDDVHTLAALSHALFAAGVLPYYLHVLDKVAGAAHFDLDQERIISIYSALNEMLPGYLVPKLVTEKPGQLSKTLWTPV